MIPKIKIHDVTTGEIIEREMNSVELAQFEIDKIKFESEITLQNQNKVKRLAILERLGLTEEEAQILLS